MFSEALAQKVLSVALSSGADFAELYLEKGRYNTINMSKLKVESAQYSKTCGAGIRLFYGQQTSYAYTASWEPEALLQTAQLAADMLKVQLKGEKAQAQVCAFQAVDYREHEIGVFDPIRHEKRIACLREAGEASMAHSAEIRQVEASYRDWEKEVEIFNSEGLHVLDTRSYGHARLSAVASDGQQFMSSGEAFGTGADFGYFEGIDWRAKGVKAAQVAVQNLHAPECPALTVPVVIDPGFGGVIFHEACGHSLEATFVASNLSVFSGKLGQQIASSKVSAADNGLIPGEWGSIKVDDEGTKAQNNLLIENGILKSYLVDRLGSRKMDHPMTGSARRESYRYAATSRMTNTYILAGTDDEEAMIAEMPEGLYAKSLGGGSVNPVTGDFNFAVNEGYWVRNGKILTPVKGATLIGTGAEVLQKIDRVGSRLKLAQGTCGSISGMIPCDVGQPRIRVSELVVGGKGGKL